MLLIEKEADGDYRVFTRKGLSAGDIRRINKLYCQSSTTAATTELGKNKIIISQSLYQNRTRVTT